VVPVGPSVHTIATPGLKTGTVWRRLWYSHVKCAFINLERIFWHISYQYVSMCFQWWKISNYCITVATTTQFFFFSDWCHVIYHFKANEETSSYMLLFFMSVLIWRSYLPLNFLIFQNFVLKIVIWSNAHFCLKYCL